tara:strand:+ start:89 stop:2665 length:2577 start_codon:yes stop_codon:yes gene_type:complete
MKITKKRLEEIIHEETTSIVNEMILKEGIWSKIKNFGAKTLGAWEKGGKIFGRGKRAEAAQAQYMQSMEKLQSLAEKHSAVLIKRLQGDFADAGYPNQEDKFEFLEQTLEMGAFYESIKKAVEDGEMEVVVANELISQLRVIVKKFLDYDLADVYKHFSEDVDRSHDDIIMEAVLSDLQKETLLEQDEQQDEKEKGPIGTEKDSTTVKGLKSNLLPAVLAAVGGASLIGKLIVESEWFKELTTQVINKDVSFTDYQEKVVGTLSPESGEGVTQMMGRVLHGDASHFGPDVNPQLMFQEMGAAGIDPKDLAQLSEDPNAFLDAWNTASGSGAGTLGEMFPMESIDLSPQDIAQFASSEVGNTVGDFAQYASNLSDADLNSVAARASEIAGAVAGADAPAYTADSIKTIISNAGGLSGNANMLSGGSSSMLGMNVAMQEFAAGGAPTSISSGAGALGLKLGKKAVLKALQPVVKKAGESVLKTTAAGKIGAMLGPYLAPLGIGLVAAAAGVKALRMKGLRSSRAQVLNDLLQGLDYLDRDGTKEPISEPRPPGPPPPPGVPDFRVPVLIRFDDDDVKYYKLKANFLKKEENRERAEKALKEIEKKSVMGRDLEENEAFNKIFEREAPEDFESQTDGDGLGDTESFEREFGRGDRASDLKSAIRKTGRRRKLKSGARTKPVFYYVFDQSIENELTKGQNPRHFRTRVLRKAIKGVKEKGNKPLTAEEAFFLIKRQGGGGTGMKGLSIVEGIEILKKYGVVVGDIPEDIGKKKGKKATRRKGKEAPPDQTPLDDKPQRRGRKDSAGAKARARQKARANQPRAGIKGVTTESDNQLALSENLRLVRKSSFEDTLQKHIKNIKN